MLHMPVIKNSFSPDGTPLIPELVRYTHEFEGSLIIVLPD